MTCTNFFSSLSHFPLLFSEINLFFLLFMNSFSEEEEKDTFIPKKNLILDIDGTLIDGYPITSTQFIIRPRPGLKEFLEFCFTHPLIDTVSIWTASQTWYKTVYENCFKDLIPESKSFYFVFEGNRCVTKSEHDQLENGEFYPQLINIKPLKKVWRKFKPKLNKSNTLIIDDTPITYTRNYGNAIPIKPFEFKKKEKEEEQDKELYKLINYLETELLYLKDVRSIEKKILVQNKIFVVKKISKSLSVTFINFYLFDLS